MKGIHSSFLCLRESLPRFQYLSLFPSILALGRVFYHALADRQDITISLAGETSLHPPFSPRRPPCTRWQAKSASFPLPPIMGDVTRKSGRRTPAIKGCFAICLYFLAASLAKSYNMSPTAPLPLNNQFSFLQKARVNRRRKRICLDMFCLDQYEFLAAGDHPTMEEGGRRRIRRSTARASGERGV